MPFTCSICGEEATRICVRCTKDACSNHLCEKCRRCSDCCECEVSLDGPHEFTPATVHASVPRQEPEPDPEPEPAPPLPAPDPDPFPEPADSEPLP